MITRSTATGEGMIVGVLALQGDFDAHQRCLAALGATALLIRDVERLGEIDGLIVPGGESTTLLRLLGAGGLESIARFAREKPTLGTCAGAILLAKDVEPDQPSAGAMDITVRRNAYGRQADSFIQTGDVLGATSDLVFIRAPRIVRTGPDVQVIAWMHGEPVGVSQNRVIATTFHPELSAKTHIHERLLDMIRRT